MWRTLLQALPAHAARARLGARAQASAAQAAQPQTAAGRPPTAVMAAGPAFASVTSVLFPILLFFFFQRYFIQGIVLTGLKE